MASDRRAFLKAGLAGVAAFWSPSGIRASASAPAAAAKPLTAGSWSASELSALGRQAGVSVLTDVASLARAAEDFGHMVHGSPRAVALPKSAAEVEKAVAFANSRRLSFTPRGVAHSQSGQSLAVGGVTLDLSGMDRVEPPDVESQSIRCGPGAKWRGVVAASAARGLIPPVLPLNLDLTVGGVLSAGGVGPASPWSGLAVSHARELEVVTGDGRRLRCSRERETRLFDAVLGGVGRCGVITSVRLALRKTQPMVRTFFLLYDTVESWLADQRALIVAGRCAHLEGFLSASVQGLKNTSSGRRPFAVWFYGLQAAFEFESGAAPEASEALADVKPYRLIHFEDSAAAGFAARYDPRFAAMALTGAAAQAHPFFECFVPVESAPQWLPPLIEALPLTLGDGHRFIFVAKKELPRFLMTPPSDEVACFAILPTGVPEPFLKDSLAALRGVHQTLIEAGGKRYLSGWLPPMDASAWQAHFGERYSDWMEAKRRFDPNRVFRSALFPES
jgi:cytokinin dehydrogenase